MIKEESILDTALKRKFNTPSIEGAIRFIVNRIHKESKNETFPISLKKITKKLGVKTQSVNNLDNDAILTIDRGQYRIEFAPNKNWKRQRFTVAHEIMHVILYDLFHNHINFSLVELSHLEKICNIGASELLVPKKNLEKDLDKETISINLITKLTEKYMASFSALSWKINDIRPNTAIYIWKKYARNKKDKHEYRVLNAFQKYTTEINHPYLPQGCTSKYLSEKEVFNNPLVKKSGKIKVLLSKEREYDYYIEPFMQDFDSGYLFNSPKSQDYNCLMILNKIQ